MTAPSSEDVVVAPEGFVLESTLGQGSSSVVYRARRGDQAYALKLMRRSSAVADASLLFRKEAAAVARLHHPGLVRIVEVGEAKGQPYLVMEVAEGHSLEHRLGLGALAEHDVVAIGKRLASTLVEVHRHGLVHRDIKPQNVILDGDRGLKLIDFGFVATTTGAEQTSTAGTLLYAAPEQLGLVKRRVDARTDLYALGAVLFECLTGHPPHPGATASEILERVSRGPRPDVKAEVPEVRPALAAVVNKLLAFDPDDRYQSARGLLADLESLDALDAQARTGPPTLGAQDHTGLGLAQAPFVGRAREKDLVAKAWQATRSGTGGAWLIRGEPGSGKTRLAQEVACSAAGDGALVLSAKCHVGDGSPLGPIREWVDDFAEQLGRLPRPERAARARALHDALANQHDAVRLLSRRLATLLGLPAERPAMGLDPERFFIEVGAILSGLVAQAPGAFLQLDDVQWLDGSSLNVLARFVSSPAAQRSLVGLTARAGAAHAAAVESVKRALGERLRLEIELGPLGPSEVSELVAGLLGGPVVERSVLERLTAVSNGNPYALSELVHALIDAGAVTPRDGAWSIDASALSELDLSSDVLGLVVNRAQRLSPVALEVLRTAAVMGDTFSTVRLAAAAEVDGHGAIDEAVQARILEVESAGVRRFVHDRVREALLQGVEAPALREMHARVAKAFDATPDDDRETVFALARHHHLGGSPPSRVYETSKAAGTLALEEHAFDEACTLLERAVAAARAAGHQGPEVDALAERLGEALVGAHRRTDARAVLQSLLEKAQVPMERGRLLARIAEVHYGAGEYATSLTHIHQAYRAIGARASTSTGSQWVWAVLRFYAWVFLRVTGLFKGWVGRERRERSALVHRLAVLSASNGYFTGQLSVQLSEGLRYMVNAHLLDDPKVTAEVNALFCVVPATMGLKAQTEKMVGTSVGIASQLGDKRLFHLTTTFASMVLFWLDDRAGAEQRRLESRLGALQWCGPVEVAMQVVAPAFHVALQGHARAAVEGLAADAVWYPKVAPVNLSNAHGLAAAQLVVLGRAREALEFQARQTSALAALPEALIGKTHLWWTRIQSLLEQEDFGPELEGHIERFLATCGKGIAEEYYNRIGFHLVGYVRLAQCERGTPTARAKARRELDAVLKLLPARSKSGLHGCHQLVLLAGRERLDRRLPKALALLARAEALATAHQSRWGQYAALVEKARVLALANDQGQSRSAAEAALAVANAEGWRPRAQRVRAEFGLATATASSDGVRGSLSSTSGSLGQVSAERVTHALLQVSLAAGSSLEPDAQARAALDVLVRLLGAERAFLFIDDAAGGAMRQLGRDGSGADLAALEGYSTTVVRAVAQSGEAKVVTGTDEGEALGSASAVAHDLRSIIACPVQHGDRTLGVVYLDSRLAKGIFSADDVTLLRAIGNHIAIALETARMARVEVERRALEKDLALTATMQALLLPPSTEVSASGCSLAAFYRPAAQSGGDWWWHDQGPRGLRVFVGDATGHGPAPAMLTASVAGAMRAAVELGASSDTPALLRTLHTAVRGLTGGDHQMTMAVLEFDVAERRLHLHAAGVPPVFVLRRDGTVAALTDKGSPLGSETLVVGQASTPVSAGDRVLLFTDGAFELAPPQGRALGLNGLRKLLTKLRAERPADALAALVAELDQLRGAAPQDDDLTLVMIDVP